MLKWDEGKFNVHAAKTSVVELKVWWSSFDCYCASVFGRKLVAKADSLELAKGDVIRYQDLKDAKRAAVRAANAFLAKAVKELAMVEIEP
jgi:hypothetical protein